MNGIGLNFGPQEYRARVVELLDEAGARLDTVL